MKLKIVTSIAALLLSGSAFVAAESVEEKYNRACVACHASGVANAPRTGDAEAWASRLEKGMDALVQSTNNGVGAMPPKGTCMDCSDEDFKGLIEYMSAASE